MIEINSDITIEELVEKYPVTVRFLSRRGITCLVCGEPSWGTLAEQARKSGIDDIDALIQEIIDYLLEAQDGENSTENKNKLYIEVK